MPETSNEYTVTVKIYGRTTFTDMQGGEINSEQEEQLARALRTAAETIEYGKLEETG